MDLDVKPCFQNRLVFMIDLPIRETMRLTAEGLLESSFVSDSSSPFASSVIVDEGSCDSTNFHSPSNNGEFSNPFFSSNKALMMSSETTISAGSFFFDEVSLLSASVLIPSIIIWTSSFFAVMANEVDDSRLLHILGREPFKGSDGEPVDEEESRKKPSRRSEICQINKFCCSFLLKGKNAVANPILPSHSRTRPVQRYLPVSKRTDHEAVNMKHAATLP